MKLDPFFYRFKILRSNTLLTLEVHDQHNKWGSDE